MKANPNEVSFLLKTARGQMDSILRMVEEDRYCIDIVNQILSVESILKKTVRVVLHAHVEHCVKDAIANGGGAEKTEELLQSGSLENCDDMLDKILDEFAAPLMALFFGLIVAQIPEVWKLTGHEKGTKLPLSSVVCMAIGLGLIIALMVINGTGNEVDTEDHSFGNMILFGLCGVVLAISKVMPGISGSSLLIALGLFDVTIHSVAHLDVYFIAPLCVGLLIGLFGFAKVMDFCLKKYRTQTYMLIMGLTIGSLLVIIQELINESLDVWEWAICAVMVVLGVAASYAFTLYGRKAAA